MLFDFESDVECRSASRFRLRIDRRGQVEYFDVVWLYWRSIFFLLPQLLKGFVVSFVKRFLFQSPGFLQFILEVVNVLARL